MEEEGGAKVGYFSKLYSLHKVFKTLKFLPIVVV
jgi:hypothetical protein